MLLTRHNCFWSISRPLINPECKRHPALVETDKKWFSQQIRTSLRRKSKYHEWRAREGWRAAVGVKPSQPSSPLSTSAPARTPNQILKAGNLPFLFLSSTSKHAVTQFYLAFLHKHWFLGGIFILSFPYLLCQIKRYILSSKSQCLVERELVHTKNWKWHRGKCFSSGFVFNSRPLSVPMCFYFRKISLPS